MDWRLILSALGFVIAFVLSGCGEHEETSSLPPEERSDSDVICSYAPSQSKVVSHLSALAGGGAAATGAVASATGLSVVAHSSGAYILTGSGGYIAGTLGTAVTGPIIVVVGVVVGGSAATVELLCAPKNHPEFVASVEAVAIEYYERSKGLAKSTVSSAQKVYAEVKAKSVKAGADAIAYAKRKSVEFADVIQSASN